MPFPIMIKRSDAKVRLGHLEAAISDYDEAIRLDPEYATARTNRENAQKELRERQKET
jgi:tetratricopeptide (TPR) repeat protein